MVNFRENENGKRLRWRSHTHYGRIGSTF